MTTVPSRLAHRVAGTLRRMLLVLLVLGCVGTLAPVASAHETYDISGVIVALSPKVIEVRTKEREIVALIIEPDTRVTKDKKTVSLGDLVLGMEVSVHAIGHSLKDASAREVVVVTRRPKRK